MGVEAGSADQALDVAQGLVDAQGQPLVTQQLAVAVVEVLRDKCERLAAGDFTRCG